MRSLLREICSLESFRASSLLGFEFLLCDSLGVLLGLLSFPLSSTLLIRRVLPEIVGRHFELCWWDEGGARSFASGGDGDSYVPRRDNWRPVVRLHLGTRAGEQEGENAFSAFVPAFPTRFWL